MPIEYRLPVPSAQVKSAILLAGLNAPGLTTVIEPEPTRDHTELMLRHFGVPIDVAETEDGGRRVTVAGHAELAEGGFSEDEIEGHFGARDGSAARRAGDPAEDQTGVVWHGTPS